MLKANLFWRRWLLRIPALTLVDSPCASSRFIWARKVRKTSFRSSADKNRRPRWWTTLSLKGRTCSPTRDRASQCQSASKANRANRFATIMRKPRACARGSASAMGKHLIWRARATEAEAIIEPRGREMHVLLDPLDAENGERHVVSSQ